MVMVFNRLKRRASPKKNGDNNMEMEEYQTRIELLSEIAEEASSITEVSTLLERILKVTKNTLGATVTTLFLNDDKKNELHSPFSVKNFDGSPHRRASAVELAVARWVAGNVIPVLVNNLEADARFQQKDDDTSGATARSIIAAPVLRGKKVIGVISSIDKDNGDDFTERDFEVIKGFASTEALILLVSMQITAIENFSKLALDQALLDGYRSTAEELANTADIQDSFGYAHSRRCKEYALLVANCLDLPPQEIKAIEFGALLHDIGKIGIDSDILCKPGPLSDKEWSLIYEHPQKGADILGDITYLKDARNIVLYHHERYDGKGYPEKLEGEDIPFGARIVAVANAFDSMTTEHSYRAALSVDEAMTELINGIGTQFCPRATEAFISAFKKREGQLPFQRNHEELKAIVAEEVEEEEVEEITIQTVKSDMNLTIEEEREAREQQAKAEKVAREQQAKAEKEAREQQVKAEKEARKQQAKDEKEARKQQAKAEKEAREQQAKDEKEAMEQQVKAGKDSGEQPARVEEEDSEQQAKSEKEAREQHARDEEEAKEQQIIDKIEAKNEQARTEEDTKKSQQPASSQPAVNGSTDTEMFHGEIRLKVPVTDDITAVRKFRKELQKIEDLRITMFGSSEEDGHMFVLSLAEPVALINAVREIPSVENVGKKGKDILVTLRNSDS